MLIFLLFSPGGGTPPLHTVSGSVSDVAGTMSWSPHVRYCSAASKLGPQMAGVKLMLDRVAGF